MYLSGQFMGLALKGADTKLRGLYGSKLYLTQGLHSRKAVQLFLSETGRHTDGQEEQLH
jgi:hypothetical protein